MRWNALRQMLIWEWLQQPRDCTEKQGDDSMPNIVIVGSGPAGVSAALYTARAGVETTVLT